MPSLSRNGSIARIFSRSAISRLVANGFVHPERGPRNEYRFSFRDVVLLRTAHRLQRAEIPTRKILRALQRLKSTLPAELPLIADRERQIEFVDAEAMQALAHYQPQALTRIPPRVKPA